MALKQTMRSVVNGVLDTAGLELVRRQTPPPPPPAPQTPTHLAEPRSPMDCAPEDVERWNAEWRRYLGREWTVQLRPHTEYSLRPDLPEAPLKMWDVTLEPQTPPLSLYAAGPDIEGRRVMEMGCGCGNLGKLLGRYASLYLGTDYSNMALQIARLVSPDTCNYVHVADRQGLEPYFGTIDTIVGRFFWIHQNFKVARKNLEFMQRFLKPEGRLYMDFYWPNPELPQGKVFTPRDPLSAQYPSATFKYSEADARELLEGLNLEIERFEVVPEHQRRYAVLAHRP